ncbi:hypothetical protein DUZ99_11215 [Xylanibacillus composti]|uniref:Uncharacterized protein n=1 Tax=Xylanibacillus composti TaxID=1572762 RepID=A0A8J4GYS6_9BACL|nr:hypothetical protein [Xylanibacillus composti]MDT9725540.1 hypothetical protein [Xylanibacillus composti]GIQ67634.1 hypothetical protein XYCOK13_04580 [Xylanibacillus composti]
MYRNDDDGRSRTNEGPWPRGGLNVEEMVQHAMNTAMKAVKQAGLAAFPNEWFPASARQSARSEDAASALAPLHAEIQESESFILIKLRFPANAHPRQYRFFVATRSLTCTGKQQEQPQTIRLPAYADKRTAKAVYKKHVLFIRVRKMKVDDTAHEIYVRYSD